MTANPQMRQLFVAWARSKGYRKPDDPNQFRAMQAEFVREFQAKAAAQHVVGAAGDSLYNSDPIARMQPPPILVRDSGGMLDVTEPETEDSDFTEMVRGRERALEQAGGDQLGAEVLYRDQQRAALNAQAPFVSTAPASVLSAVLGTTQAITCGADPIQLCAWAGDNSETRPVTCIVAPIQPILLDTQGAVFRPFARISFATSAAQISVDLDVDRGIQCTVSRSALQLLVGLAADVSGNGVPTAQQILNISAMLSFDAAMRFAPVTRTIWMDNPDAGNVTRFAIPAFAKRMSVLTAGNNYTVARQVTVEDSIGNDYSFVVAANTQMSVPIDLPGDAVNVSQSDATGAHDVGPCAFVFELSL